MIPDTIRAALDDLCRLASVNPAESSPEAGRAILAAIAAAGVTGERSDPAGCAVLNWLRRATGLTLDIRDRRRATRTPTCCSPPTG